MLAYFFRRVMYMLLIVWVSSVVSFLIVQLPAGDYVDDIARQYATRGQEIDEARLENLRARFGLDQPVYVQYVRWLVNILQGDPGWSFSESQPVERVVGDRIALTATLTLSTLFLEYLIAVPIGIYSATHQYSIGDYFGMFFGFIGMGMPSFLLALIMMYVFLNQGWKVGGLFSSEYLIADWSWGKLVDLLKHLPLPILIIGTTGTAGLIRVMRATLLDELGKQYVITARSKGVHETRLLFKYPVRVALNPIASTIGWTLPGIVSGGVITEMVLGLQTTGPKLFNALMSEDIFLASSLLLALNSLTVIGTFISDMVLVIVDPRIRFTAREA